MTLRRGKINLKNKRSQKSKSLTINILEEKVTEIINLYGEDEKVNIRTARKNFNFKKRLKGPPNFTAYLYDVKLFKDFSDFIEDCLNEEEISINDIQKQIYSLTSYYREMSNLKLGVSNVMLGESNLKLQNSLSWFPNKLVILGIVVGVAGVLVSNFFGR
jgi:hypothetical protein